MTHEQANQQAARMARLRGETILVLEIDGKDYQIAPVSEIPGGMGIVVGVIKPAEPFAGR